MVNIKVRDLADTTTITSDNQLMVLTNDQNNLVQNITVSNFNQNIISTQTDNGITQGSDGGLYVNNADSGVTAGTYQYPKNLVVNEKGQIVSLEQGQEAQVPIATTTQAGIVKPDGNTIAVANDGTISANILVYEVGDVIWRLFPSNDAGKHLLDGALIQGTGSYSAFVTYIAGLVTDYSNLFVTEADWQTTVTTYGACGKFVYDSTNNTVRLPKVTGIIEGTIDVTALGDLIEAGLPNIIGEWSPGLGSQVVSGSASGCVEVKTTTIGGDSNSQVALGMSGFTIDASRSNSIYDNSTTVQPQTIKGYYYIVIATSIKTNIQVDIDEIATDLNGKADVDGTNMSPSVKNFDGQWVSSELTLANNVTYPTSTDIEYSLATYLPNDSYNYEVVFTCILNTGSTSGNTVNGNLATALIPTSLYRLGYVIARTAAVNSSASTVVVPIGTDRKIKVHAIPSSVGTFRLSATAYRRIGTNQ